MLHGIENNWIPGQYVEQRHPGLYSLTNLKSTWLCDWEKSGFSPTKPAHLYFWMAFILLVKLRWRQGTDLSPVVKRFRNLLLLSTEPWFWAKMAMDVYYRCAWCVSENSDRVFSFLSPQSSDCFSYLDRRLHLFFSGFKILTSHACSDGVSELGNTMDTFDLV